MCGARAILVAALSAVFLTALGAPIPEDCQEKWWTQRLDHFRWHGGQEPTFQQRYFVCDKNWSTSPNGQRGPIFFYAGNEGPVTGYIKSAGLMFENREAFGALVLFVEHRYYGETQPFGPDSWRVDPSYLTVEQAMADMTSLLHNLTTSWGATHSPVVAFGGSYGGMLAAWMRRRYPHIIAGAVAASAPVGQFPAVPGFNPSAFWEVVTRDATPAAGSAPDCVDNVRDAFKQLFAVGSTPDGRSQLQQTFKLCEALADEQHVEQLAYWAQGAFDAFAMGNYPFASDYMTGEGQGELPAWPMRVACQYMTRMTPSATTALTAAAAPTTQTPQAGKRFWHKLGRKLLTGGKGSRATSHEAQEASLQGNDDLLARLAGAASVLYNASGTVSCYSLDLAGPAAGSVGAWDYQVCTQFLGQELPYFPAAATSMFWDQGPFDWSTIVEHCRTTWGVEPSWSWMAVEHGGLDWSGTSNIVFSNGLLDPWSVFGVLSDVSDTVVAVTIPDVAHHLDLMYGRPDDSAALRAARQTILQHVQQWVQAAPAPSTNIHDTPAGAHHWQQQHTGGLKQWGQQQQRTRYLSAEAAAALETLPAVAEQ